MMWRKIWTDSDWTIIICTILLVGIGLTAIGSATHVNHEAIGFGSFCLLYTSVVGLPVEHVYEELCKALGAK